MYRVTAGLVILASTLLLEAGYAAEMPLRLRSDGLTITPGQANLMSPAALGEALLLGPHPPVTEVVIGPEGLEPPTPPNTAVETRLKLFLKPSRIARSGFCKRQIATIYLAPVFQMSDGALPPARSNKIATQTGYRWVGFGQNASTCNGPRYKFFLPNSGQEEKSLSVVHLLASASDNAKRGLRIAFPVSIVDKEGEEMEAYAHEHPKESMPPALKIITDAYEALASLPVDAITYVGPGSAAYPRLFGDSTFSDGESGSQAAYVIFLGNDWEVGLMIQHDRITQARLIREVPPPF